MASIETWTKAGREHGVDIDFLREDKGETIRRMAALGLPMARTSIASLTQFLDDPGKYFADLQSEDYVCSLLPSGPEYNRKKRADLSREKVMKYVHSNIDRDRNAYNGVILMECFDVAFSGIITVSQDGERALVESATGKLANVKRGRARFRDENELFATSPDQWRWSMNIGQNHHVAQQHWSMQNDRCQEVMTRTVQYIPHQRVEKFSYGDREMFGRDGMYQKQPGERIELRRGTAYLPGYYEFIVVKKPSKNHRGFDLRPIFNDYKDEPAYAGAMKSTTEPLSVAEQNGHISRVGPVRNFDGILPQVELI